jgi:aminoglycoside phosphotransferase (APT) family kinase protein
MSEHPAALAAWLEAKLGAAVEIDEWRRHAEGFSWQTYTFRARWAGGSAAYAVRREPEDGLLAPYDIVGQYRLHEALVELGGVPVPALRWLELDPAVLGMPFYVMDRVDGHVPVQWRPDDPIAFPDEAAREAIGEAFVDALAAIHSLDWRATGLPGPRDEVGHWERLLDEAVLVEVPLLREAFAWLRAHPASSGRVGLVHGDYRIGNFILAPDRRIAAVLDWELAHVGDPVEDIAWAGLKLFRGRSALWSQLLAPEAFLARYEARTGLRVEPDVLRYFTVLCTLRAVIPYLRAARAFEEGRARDLRLAAMGHQCLHVFRHLAGELAA